MEFLIKIKIIENDIRLFTKYLIGEINEFKQFTIKT
jgi:hypothetical protein